MNAVPVNFQVILLFDVQEIGVEKRETNLVRTALQTALIHRILGITEFSMLLVAYFGRVVIKIAVFSP